MNLDERNKEIVRVFEEELIPLMTAKGHDYSGLEDAFSNLKDFGWRGIVVRLGDKYHRLKNNSKTGELRVKDETIEDTLKDMIIYSFLALLLFRRDI